MPFFVSEEYQLIADPLEFRKLSNEQKLDLLYNSVEIYESATGKESPSAKWPKLVFKQGSPDKEKVFEVTPDFGTDLDW